LPISEEGESLKLEMKDLVVLVAEDDSEFNKNISRTLRYKTKNVFSASNGKEALGIIQNEKIDILLIDFSMPELDGYDFCREIRKNNESIPIIMMSCFADVDKLLKSIKCDIVDFLVKPFRYEDLKLAFENALKKLSIANPSFRISKDILYDINSKIVTYDNTETQLTKTESNILEYLVKNKNKIVSKDNFRNEIFTEDISDDALKNNIARLRKKLYFIEIKSFRYMGYKLCLE